MAPEICAAEFLLRDAHFPLHRCFRPQDIVMPNLDGVSATSLIRQFDPRTPIISMTSNSAPNELLNYMSHGMNDILPKPFTKEGLLNMLEKHLIHLKTVQKMDEIPKALGLKPLSEDMVQSVLSATAANAASMNISSQSTPGGSSGPLPMAAAMGNGPESSGLAGMGLNGASSSVNFNPASSMDAIENPLSGMGFSDDEYISMLQNLISAGAVSDNSRGELSDTLANVFGALNGEGSSGSRNSKEPSPFKRSNDQLSPLQGVGDSDSGKANKRSRFTEFE